MTVCDITLEAKPTGRGWGGRPARNLVIALAVLNVAGLMAMGHGASQAQSSSESAYGASAGASDGAPGSQDRFDVSREAGAGGRRQLSLDAASSGGELTPIPAAKSSPRAASPRGGSGSGGGALSSNNTGDGAVGGGGSFMNKPADPSTAPMSLRGALGRAIAAASGTA